MESFRGRRLRLWAVPAPGRIPCSRLVRSQDSSPGRRGQVKHLSNGWGLPRRSACAHCRPRALAVRAALFGSTRIRGPDNDSARRARALRRSFRRRGRRRHRLLPCLSSQKSPQARLAQGWKRIPERPVRHLAAGHPGRTGSLDGDQAPRWPDIPGGAGWPAAGLFRTWTGNVAIIPATRGGP